MRAITLCAVTALVVLLCFSEGDAKCCGQSSFGVCADCTLATPCCATRKCNIFCCACNGVCREGGCRGRRDVDGVTPADDRNVTTTGWDVIQVGDLNGDGKLDYEEAIGYITKHKGHDRETAELALIELDVDNNKIFSVEEIDE